MDPHAQRTMLAGILVSFAIYGVSLVLIPFVPGPTGRIASIALLVVSVVTLGLWYLAVRGGWRIGKMPGRAQRRAKEHKKHEQEKRARMR